MADMISACISIHLPQQFHANSTFVRNLPTSHLFSKKDNLVSQQYNKYLPLSLLSPRWSQLISSPSWRFQMKKPCKISCVREDGQNGQPKTLEDLRRSANYHPSIWDHRDIQATKSSYANEKSNARLEELKLKVRLLLESCKERPAQLLLIDSMQRLGVERHFEDEIAQRLGDIYASGFWASADLHDTALCFRLLRQHGHHVPSDVFERYRDGKKFKNEISQDVMGLLSLYEASHLDVDGEDILSEAKDHCTKNLWSIITAHVVDGNLTEFIRHALQIPVHWRMPRLESKDFIEFYERKDDKIPSLLDLAKLDFNITQSLHQQEMRELSSWWNDLGLAQRLDFSRDRLLENYLWAVGITHQPQFSKCRVGLTKMICILTVIDDIYDVYGLLGELELFTDAVKSWDLEAMDSLPDYMKLCYLALYNFVNETAAEIEKDYGWDAKVLCRKEWQRLCEAYLKEAEWFHRGYRPALEEYLENAWISVGGPIAMSYVYFLTGNTLSNNFVSLLQQGGLGLVYWSSLIARLSDDLGTSEAEMERGDIPKSVQCHMNESGCSEKASMEKIRSLVSHSWKKLNEQYMGTSLPRDFAAAVLNMARTSQCIFEHGDGIGTSTGMTKSRITSLFFDSYFI